MAEDPLLVEGDVTDDGPFSGSFLRVPYRALGAGESPGAGLGFSWSNLKSPFVSFCCFCLLHSQNPRFCDAWTSICPPEPLRVLKKPMQAIGKKKKKRWNQLGFKVEKSLNQLEADRDFECWTSTLHWKFWPHWQWNKGYTGNGNCPSNCQTLSPSICRRCFAWTTCKKSTKWARLATHTVAADRSCFLRRWNFLKRSKGVGDLGMAALTSSQLSLLILVFLFDELHFLLTAWSGQTLKALPRNLPISFRWNLHLFPLFLHLLHWNHWKWHPKLEPKPIFSSSPRRWSEPPWNELFRVASQMPFWGWLQLYLHHLPQMKWHSRSLHSILPGTTP